MKIAAKVTYFGKKFAGWQKQPNAKTIQEEIENKLSQILNTPTQIYASGRTDAGVHAQGQVFHFEVKKDVDLDQLRYSLNSILDKDIHINSFAIVNDDFHARFSAKEKHYQYVINLGEEDPFLNDVTYFYPYEFNYSLFKKALLLFVGTHSFNNFTSKEEDEQNYIRNISSISCSKSDSLLYIDLIGNGFMRYMIRFIIGTCLAVASKKEDISYIQNRLDNDNKMISSYKAPSEGLFLIDIIY